jgi:hypothetical protein
LEINARILKTIKAVLKEVQADAAFESRRYMMECIPGNLDGILEAEMLGHNFRIQPAAIAFHRAVFLIEVSKMGDELKSYAL